MITWHYSVIAILRLGIGTDHQRIAKLDRENEVALLPKISANVGRVSSQSLFSCPG